MLQLAMIFCNHMVLQRDKRIPIWGVADAGTNITVDFDGNKVSTSTRGNSTWYMELPEHKFGMGYVMEVSAEGKKITLTDICVGEVWIAAGQSNMEFWMGYEKHFDEVQKQTHNPLIRFFDYPEVSYEGELEDFDYEKEGFWRIDTEEDLGYFSAVGYYFAREIQKTTKMPIGIVGCNWGGINAACFVDPEYLMGTEGEFRITEYEKQLKHIDLNTYREKFIHDPLNDRTHHYPNPDLYKKFGIGLNQKEQDECLKRMGEQEVEALAMGPYCEFRPGGLYETMLKKIAPYAIRGVIWYQGENDADSPNTYQCIFTLLIKNWRDLWKEEIPFLFVQLAPFYRWLSCDGLAFPKIREAQYQVSKTITNSWMASIGDAGMYLDIHPKDKKVVGERLALLARGHIYEETILCDAPEFQSVIRDDSNLVIRFLHADGLHIVGDALHAMRGFNKSGQVIELTEAIIETDQEGEKLVLKNCLEIVKIAFVSTDYYEENLYNRANIPALPFTCKISS